MPIFRKSFVLDNTPITKADAFTGDKNGDGVADGLAFLLGADNPNVDAKALLPTASQTGGDLVMTFSCLAGSAAGLLLVRVKITGGTSQIHQKLGPVTESEKFGKVLTNRV